MENVLLRVLTLLDRFLVLNITIPHIPSIREKERWERVEKRICVGVESKPRHTPKTAEYAQRSNFFRLLGAVGC